MKGRDGTFVSQSGPSSREAIHLSIAPAEWRRVALWSAVILAFTFLPVALGYLRSNDSYMFTGAAHHPEDVMSYLAKMQQGYAGSWAARLPYAIESHPAIPFFYLFYTFLGHLALWTGLALPLVYHAARLACAAFLLWAAYRFIAFVLPNPTWRWTAFLLTTISSGLGVWVVLVTGSFTLGGITPIDLWPLDYYTFALLFLSPHQTLGIALFFIIVQSVVTYWETSRPRHLVPGVTAALAEGFIYPFMPLAYGTVLAIAWLWERRWRGAAMMTAGAAVLVVVLPLPVVINYWLGLRQHPVWLSFSSQNLTLSPPIWHYGLGYGLVGILAVPGAVWAWGLGARGWGLGAEGWGRAPRAPHAGLAVLIVLVSLILAYVPANFQRRLGGGAHIPMCTLAAAGIHAWLVPLWGKWRPASQARLAPHLPKDPGGRKEGTGLVYREGLTRAALVGVSAISSVYVWLSILISVLTYSPGLYISSDTAVGLRWLLAGTPPEAAILSAYHTGMVIPAYTGRRVFWGHELETPFLSRKQAEAEGFFSAATPDADRLALLRNYGVNFIFYGLDEKAMGDFDPQLASYLQPVFRHNSVTIYKVVDELSAK